jgi:hypothetical protein
LFDSLESAGDFVGDARIPGVGVHPSRVSSRHRNADRQNNSSSERTKGNDYLWSHFKQSSRRWRRLRVS